MENWVLSLVAIILVFPILIRLIVFFKFQGIRFQKGERKIVDASSVPDWEREVLDGAKDILIEQGFEFRGYGFSKSLFAGNPDSHYIGYFELVNDNTWATVQMSESPIEPVPFSIAYFSFFVNGKVLMTLNMTESLIDYDLQYYEIQTIFFADWNLVYKSHKARHDELNGKANSERISLPAVSFILEKIQNDSLELLVDKKILLPADEMNSRLKLGLKPSLTFTQKMVKYSKKFQSVQKEWQQKGKLFPLPFRAEAEAFLRAQKLKPQVNVWVQLILIVISLIAFSYLFEEKLSLTFMFIFLVVLGVHEMGHALMMRWVGFKNVNIFFIPLFGAVATGSPNKEISAWKEALVLIAGPLPGLVAGILLYIYPPNHYQDFFSELRNLAITLNAFNLLPIIPLDGGRLLDLILFRRTPKIGQIFVMASSLALAGLAYYGQSFILGAVAVVLILTSGKGKQRAKLLAQWRNEKEKLRSIQGGPTEFSDQAELVTEFFTLLKRKPSDTFANRMTEVKLMVESAHLKPPSKISSILLLIILIGICSIPVITYFYFLDDYKQLQSNELPKEEAMVYQKLCKDSSVVTIRNFKFGDEISFSVQVISTDDTARIRNLFTQFQAKYLQNKQNPIGIHLNAPVWELGGLDSNLVKGLKYPHDEEYDEEYDEENEPIEGEKKTTSKPNSAATDSINNEIKKYEKKVDSIRNVELNIWRNWSKDQKNNWLKSYKKNTEHFKNHADCIKVK